MDKNAEPENIILSQILEDENYHDLLMKIS